jgi:protein-disulfide isomerase|tara:strand:- start:3854 stop:4498 length:645 start_codon:yes stop_codon:yes gene_type:complete
MYFISIPIIVGIILGIYITTNLTSDSMSNQPLITNSQLIKNGSPQIGLENATISIVEFGDYQCTFCYKFHQDTLNDIKIEYIDTGKANYVYRDFPLNGPSSILASEASYCADDQGKYWEYHNTIFKNWAGENTGWVNMNSLLGFAAQLDLDIIEFSNCMDRHMHYQKVINNESYAKQIGISATPTFLIFDDAQLIRIIGAQPLEKFQNALNQIG